MARLPGRLETPARVQDTERRLKEYIASVAASFRKSADDVYNRVLTSVSSMFWTRDDSDARFAFKTHTHDAADLVSGTVRRPVNASSVQSDLFLGGSFTGTSATMSDSVTASVGVFNGGMASTDVRQRVLSTNFAAVYVDQTGQIGIAPSTRSKKNVGDVYAVDMAKWLTLPLYQYTYKDDPTHRMQVGFLADDLEAAGLTEFCLYDINGKLQGLRTDQLIAGLHSAYTQSRVQSQARLSSYEQSNANLSAGLTSTQKSVTDLTTRVAIDETAATALTTRVTTLESRQPSYAAASDLTALTGRVTTLEGRQASYALATDVTALTTRVKALEDANKTRLRQRVTSATMAALTVLNSSATVTITWPTAFADANYTPTIVSVTPPSGVLTSISARITGQTATTCTVLVYTAGIALSAGTTVTVDGIHL
jgi:hypothetical protein